MDEKRLTDLGVSPLKAEFDRIAAIDNPQALAEALARFHMIEEPRESCQLWVEIMSEVARNPQIGTLRKKIDQFIEGKIRFALEMARDRGQTAPDADLEPAVQFLITYADGQANAAMVFNAIGLLTLIGIVLYAIVALIETKLLHYIPKVKR